MMVVPFCSIARSSHSTALSYWSRRERPADRMVIAPSSGRDRWRLKHLHAFVEMHAWSSCAEIVQQRLPGESSSPSSVTWATS
jgi:hypothetical protein